MVLCKVLDFGNNLEKGKFGELRSHIFDGFAIWATSLPYLGGFVASRGVCGGGF
ncbi:MAG: hypothetical protein V1889_02060 [archaeon]